MTAPVRRDVAEVALSLAAAQTRFKAATAR